MRLPALGVVATGGVRVFGSRFGAVGSPPRLDSITHGHVSNLYIKPRPAQCFAVCVTRVDEGAIARGSEAGSGNTVLQGVHVIIAERVHRRHLGRAVEVCEGEQGWTRERACERVNKREGRIV